MKRLIGRKSGVFLCLAMAALLFAGCGGEYVDRPGSAGVSGGAVSASTVSGQAVSASAVREQAVVDSDGYSRYTYCSDWNLYYIRDYYSEEARLIERNLEDGSEREIRLDGIHEVCYADNDWVYYTKVSEWEEEDEFYSIVGEVWRSPIDKSSSRMDEGKEELVLKAEDEEGMVSSRSHVGRDHRGIQCDGRYIVYEGGEWTGQEGETLESSLRVYDIHAGKYVCEEILHTGSFDTDMRSSFLCGDSVFLYDNENQELVRVKLETGEKTTVVPVEDYYWDYMQSSIFTASDEDIFWINEEEEAEEIWQYHLPGQKRLCLITNGEVRKLLEKKGLLKCSIGGKKHAFDYEACFVRADRLYVQVGINGEGSHGEICQNRVILSKELGAPEATPVFEEKLSKCLANPQKRQKVFSKKYDGIYGRQPHKEKAYFKTRGFCVSMTEDGCLMYVENADEKKNMPAWYDFQTDTMRFLEKSEDWPSCYLYDRDNRILTGDPGEFFERYATCDKMPNNYDCLED